ncbi:hypothetical protein P3T76_010405 [Phytophthora citrophthora]|uniref:Uncharacterized protein n=1 Tax=Phytophthora citrophthora TaxID=4793 RepID=A0AAD9GCA3_9STRA|nr:hypothetical protein P3T76_010405 [Phytophthora citrophthora]
METCDQVPAESLLKVLLTEFGLSHVIVNSNGERSTETFYFNEKTLPLIHDVVCGIRYVYDPPIDRLVPDHENSVDNPLYEQGLSRRLRTPVEPHPQELMEFLSAVPGWNTSSEWRGDLVYRTPFDSRLWQSVVSGSSSVGYYDDIQQ